MTQSPPQPPAAPAAGRDPATAGPQDRRLGLPLWIWLGALTAAIVAVLLIVGRGSFAP